MIFLVWVRNTQMFSLEVMVYLLWSLNVFFQKNQYQYYINVNTPEFWACMTNTIGTSTWMSSRQSRFNMPEKDSTSFPIPVPMIIKCCLLYIEYMYWKHFFKLSFANTAGHGRSYLIWLPNQFPVSASTLA